MPLPLHELAQDPTNDPNRSIVRLTENGIEFFPSPPQVEVKTTLIPDRPLQPGEQYRFHFDMTKCIRCRSREVACNEQNNTPANLRWRRIGERWRRIGEIEGGTWPNTDRFYLSIGCNHCLSADCIKGCPVDAYTKDPFTGIVLHSVDACIGYQHCVWNCPYSVPQFNPERGVVGKCDMCHGRLTDGLEPACVNACPENAIEIEIVNQLEWRSDHGIETALLYGRAKAAFIGWTMGVNHSTQASVTVAAINNLALITGNIGRTGAAPFSITGQCNAGTRESGFTASLPGYREFDNPRDREDLARSWNIPVDRIPAARGLAYPDIIEAAVQGKIKALWFISTNPAVSFPNYKLLEHALRFVESSSFKMASTQLPPATSPISSCPPPSGGRKKAPTQTPSAASPKPMLPSRRQATRAPTSTSFSTLEKS